MIKSSFSIIFLIALLAGCAQPGLKVVEGTLSKSKPCCTDYAKINYEKLVPKKSKRFKIWTDSPAFSFDTGYSYFKAFELPTDGSPVHFKVKSVFRKDVFFPVVTILNSKFERVSYITSPTIEYHPPGLENGYVGGEFDIDFKQDEKYLIIHTPEYIVGNAVESKTDVMMAVPTGSGMLFMPISGSFSHTYSYIGNLAITLD